MARTQQAVATQRPAEATPAGGTPTEATPPEATKPARPTKQRGQGQWALGYREPLNPNERSKRDDDPLNVRQRILDIYAHTGFAGIDPADLRGRFRWFGLYTQRRPGISGGRTAVLEPHELDDEYFMLRIRIDGGRVTSDAMRAIGGIATEFGRDLADVTDRQNVQLHWIRIEDVPEIWRRLDAVGLDSTEACGDTPRVILGCPLAGVLAAEIVDPTEEIQAVRKRWIGDPAFSNLPRKFKSSISGCASHCTNHEINDIAFVGVRGPNGQRGYDLWIGGGLSTNPRFAQRLGVFVRPEQVEEVWAGVTGVFRDYGYRRSRAHARLKFLLADWGPERFREVLEREYLNGPLPDGPEPAPYDGHRGHAGVTEQADGRYAVGVPLRSGRTSGTELVALADLADQYGEGRLATTAQQQVVLLDVEPAGLGALTAELDARDLPVKASPFRAGTIACTGIEFCKLAIVETKGRAEWLRQELERRLPAFDQPLTINVNGCPNSCARFQVADIGLKGSVQSGPDGDVEVFQVHLGGRLGGEASFGRKFRGLKVTADDTADYLERILRGYLARRTAGEPFAAYVARAEEAWLR
jgi:sulfite reductase (ferredoxin)